MPQEINWELTEGNLDSDIFAVFECDCVMIRVNVDDTGTVAVELTEIDSESVNKKEVWERIEKLPGLDERVRTMLVENKGNFHNVNTEQHLGTLLTMEYRYGPTLREALNRFEEEQN